MCRMDKEILEYDVKVDEKKDEQMLLGSQNSSKVT